MFIYIFYITYYILTREEEREFFKWGDKEIPSFKSFIFDWSIHQSR